jgi:hypothetical protein
MRSIYRFLLALWERFLELDRRTSLRRNPRLPME